MMTLKELIIVLNAQKRMNLWMVNRADRVDKIKLL
jgi:hypothetical protein